ncbi:MAG: radical SAM protein [Phycisphaerae bacterium]|nr:radical SAM protein [Phycisphaerae bacterium]
MPPPMHDRAVYLETFGCQMNELDSELVGGALRSLGYRFTADAQRAGVILYNTCSVREHAEQKVWSRLGELAERKREDPSLVVGVLGCLAERDGQALIRRLPVVDLLCGPGELDKLPHLLANAIQAREGLMADGVEVERAAATSARQVALQGSASRRSGTLAAAEDSLERLDLSRSFSPVDGAGRRFSAYVRITRGCNKFCAYCVVPFTRGAEVHRPPDHVVDECRRLADEGVVEITLLGQTVNHYRFEHGSAVTVNGLTQPQKGRSYRGGHRRDPYSGAGVTTFAGLLARIHDAAPSVERLRFVTSYPRDFGDDALEAVRDHPRICRYLHVPPQSGSDRVLAAMNRGYTASQYLEFIDRARHVLDQPERGRPLMLAGDFIVGFPGETEDDFEATAALLERVRFKNSFIFKYSPRPGTVAFDRLPDDVPDETKRRRNSALLDLQARISAQVSRAQVGATFPVLIEGPSPRHVKTTARREAVGLTVGGLVIDGPGPTPQRSDSVQLAGRTEGDLIVFVDVAPDAVAGLIGRIVPVSIRSCTALALHGEPAWG